jgi:hypothetical protein
MFTPIKQITFLFLFLSNIALLSPAYSSDSVPPAATNQAINSAAAAALKNVASSTGSSSTGSGCGHSKLYQGQATALCE